jgi:hypothetical protein
MNKEVRYIDKNGIEQTVEFVEIDNGTLIYRDKDGIEKATANWSQK